MRLTADQAAQLGVPEGAAALYFERRTMLEDGTPLEFVRSQYRGDAYDFIVELNLAGGRLPGRAPVRSPPAAPAEDGVMRRFLSGARLFTGDRMLDEHGIWIDGDRIAGVQPVADAPAGTRARELPADTLLVPGFVDVQVNGAGGVLFNDTPTAAAALAIAAAVRRTGTTGVLPTLITDEPDKLRAACDAAVEALAHPAERRARRAPRGTVSQPRAAGRAPAPVAAPAGRRRHRAPGRRLVTGWPIAVACS